MPQERSNRMCRERRTVQQATTRVHPSLGNDALQLFRDEDTLASARWDCEEMDTIYGFCNAKMWIKNDWQNRATTTHNFLCVARMEKFCC